MYLDIQCLNSIDYKIYRTIFDNSTSFMYPLQKINNFYLSGRECACTIGKAETEN